MRPAEPASMPLAVLRHAPEGDVELVGQVVVSFNQPMVPLASLSELEKTKSPLVLTPEVPGRHRWVDPQTLMFEPTGRLPYANEFEARVLAGTSSASGEKLAQDYVWKIRTPLPAVEGTIPYGNAQDLRPETSFDLLFNAAVEPASIAPFVSLRSGQKSVPVTVTRIDPTELREGWKNERALRVKPKSQLPLATKFELELAPGLPSSEGSLKSKAAWKQSYKTFSPLVVKTVRCAWGSDESGACQVGTPLLVEFNNSLKSQKLAPFITVSPAVSDLSFEGWGTHVQLEGSFKPETSYTVTVKAGIVDVFEQKLASQHSGKVTIGSRSPMLALSGQNASTVLEANLSGMLPLQAVNVPKATLRMARVQPAQIADTVEWLSRWNRERLASLRQDLSVEHIAPAPERNVSKHSGINVRKALGGQKYGIVVLELEYERQYSKQRETEFQSAIVQVTDLGLTATWAKDEIHVLVTSLSTGKPVAGAEISYRGGRAISDANGLAKVAVDAKRLFRDGESSQRVLLARLGEDLSYLDIDSDAASGLSLQSILSYEHSPRLAGTVFAERGIYRPGETAHLTAFVRQEQRGTTGDLSAVSGNKSFTVLVRNGRWEEVFKKTVEASAQGTIGLDLPLPKDAVLGRWTVEVQGALQGSLMGEFTVAEYRAPEFRVSTSVEPELPHRVGATRRFDIEGAYFFGAPMSGADYKWVLRRSANEYRPPNNDGFRFGIASPWWWRRWDRFPRQEQVIAGSGTLDAKGKSSQSVVLKAGSDEYPAFTYDFEAIITDANRQTVASSTSLVAHRTLERVGIRLERGLVKGGESVGVEAIATNLDGKRISGRKILLKLLELRPENEETLDEGDEHEEVQNGERRIEVDRCSVTSAEKPQSCKLKLPKSGAYVVRAELETESGVDAAEAWIWASGEAALPGGSEGAEVLLMADKERYAPGETARVMISSPFAEGRGFFSVTREGFAELVPFEVKESSAIVEVKVREEWLPSVEMQVILSRGRTAPPPTDAKEDEGRPRWATGQGTLAVDSEHRKMQVEALVVPSTVSPGAEVEIQVKTADPQGKAKAGFVTVMLVDEAVLSLTGFETPNPLESVYRQRESGVGSQDTRLQILTQQMLDSNLKEEEMGGGALKKGMMAERAMMAPSPSSAGGADAGAPTVRADFRSTAFFERTLLTDKSGKASVKVKLPDNLTEFRLMAVATDGERLFGSNESRLVVRQPLIVRPSLPRFLNLGDHFEASAVVNNETGEDAEIAVRMLAVNATIESPVKTVKIPAGRSLEVRWMAQAGQPGPAKFQVAAISLGETRFSDAAEVVLPTLIPATAEAFASYGSTLGSVLQPLSAPSDALPGFGGLDIELSSTALTGLKDAAQYLVEYPFECVEQTASRLLPLLTLGELLDEFGIDTVASPEARKEMLKKGLEKLVKAQNSDGGFPSWGGGSQSYLHLTAWVTFVLQEAKANGVEVDLSMLSRALTFLVTRHANPVHDWERHNQATRALVALVLARNGVADLGLQQELMQKELPLFAKAWLLEAWTLSGGKTEADTLLKQLENAAVESAGVVHFSSQRTEDLRLIMHSDDRSDAIVLRALVKTRPEHPLIDKAQRGVVRGQTRGRWSSTQANAWSLLAMRDYFKVFESQTPAFDARAWVGETYAGGNRFEGRSTDIASITVPMATLQSQAQNDLLLAKEGEGRLYYRFGLRYAPMSLKLDALEAGFAVTRLYEGLDDPKDVSRDEDGTWRVKAGARVRVKLQVVAPDRRYWVALIDPMPAGFEGLDPSLKTSSQVDEERSGRGRPYWYGGAWNHTELRDDQGRAFADLLWAGVWEHEYVAQATGIGTFVVPPARAEEMYAPETFGRTASDRVVVEAR